MSKNDNTKVRLYKRSRKPFGHGDPSVAELVGEMTYGEANAIKIHNRYSDENEYVIEFPAGELSPTKSKGNDQKFDALVFIGRFQPFHNGHKAVIDAALQQAKEVVIVVGSSFQARNIRNPFTFEERKEMIDAVYATNMMENPLARASDSEPYYVPRVKVVPVSDYPYDDNKWISAIQKVVDDAIPDAKDIGLIGHSKDSTSYYLNIFPRWKNHIEVENVDGINATDIREALLFGEETGKIEQKAFEKMPKIVLDYMINICHSDWFDVLHDEYNMVTKYKKPYQKLTYEDMAYFLAANSGAGLNMAELLMKFDKEFRPQFPPTFHTVDAVVVQSGHILLVKRGDMPGKGQWALPGGFLNQDETMLDGAIRELKEETKIKVPVPVLKGSIKSSKTFDAPNRSSRGRTITQAFLIDLGVGELPKVKGSDDAELARWIPFNELKQESFFEDHYHIVNHFLNIG